MPSRHRDTLFKGLPIVFLGINDVGNAMHLVERHGITGVLETLSLNETLDLIRRVAPNTRQDRGDHRRHHCPGRAT